MNTTTLLIIIGVLMSLGLFGLFGSRSDIAPADARKLVAEGALLLDVRTTEEFAEAHIEGAVNIPLHELQARLRELPDTQRPIVVYCRSGNRSGQAEDMLKQSGYPRVYNLGAMTSW